MSKGNAIIGVRVKPELLARVQQTIERRNQLTREAPWSMTDFVLAAVHDKLRHLDRARRQTARRRKGAARG
jgi:hypothetical protein